MSKYTNPFQIAGTAECMIHSSGVRTDEQWSKGILGITINKRYDDHEPYYTYDMQLTLESFEYLVRTSGNIDNVQRIANTQSEFYTVYVNLDPYIKVFTLVPIEVRRDKK